MKRQQFKSHPWHGLTPGDKAPKVVDSYIEIVPTDTVKFEVDKISGHLRIDRPQKYSNQTPTLYGFIPQTFCSNRTAAIASEAIGRDGIMGDGDPLDICVVTERPILHGDFILKAIPIGGLRMIDKGEADDKIIAVMEGDSVYGSLTDISQLAPGLVDRLRHYFLTYKAIPGEQASRVEIAGVYDQATAHKVISASIQDYIEAFGDG